MKYIAWITFLLMLVACQDKQREDITSLLREWNGKTVQFPEKMFFTIRGNDTVDYSIEGKYKILSYVDSTGCTSCKLGLKEWSKYIAQIDSITDGSVKFLFFFFPKDGTEIYQILRIDKFETPICIDNEDALNKLNRFPQDERFQTLLLNESNQVLAMGNPIHNPKVKDLYLKIIQGKDTDMEPAKPMTTVSINQNSADMGTFDWQQEQTATFTLSNTGDKLLAIEMIDTSCGCITVDYKQEPVHPGGSVTLHVSYKAEQPEYFSKTVTVYCNAEGAPIRLTVSGNAK